MGARTPFFFFLAFLALGYPALSRAETTYITSNTTLAAGDYTYDTLVVASSSTLTLASNPAATSSFLGVTIRAQNISIESGSKISAYGTGYPRYTGPGTPGPANSHGGASYGGAGQRSAATSTYGSALDPTELGSGSYGPGGGAIRFIVSDTFDNRGSVDASGKWSSSGGSINLTTGTLAGTGSFTARGGDLTNVGYYIYSGGGGRIAVRYGASTFSGTFDVSSPCSSYGCGSPGTVALIDTTTGTLSLPGPFRFQANDSPIHFSQVRIPGGSATSESGAVVSADSISAIGADLSFASGLTLQTDAVSLGNASTMSFSGTDGVAIKTLDLSGRSVLTTAQGYPLAFSLDALSVSSDSRIDAAKKGYPAMQGPGAPHTAYEGASYGGIGYNNSATSTYGSAEKPIDLGSGAVGAGGGALALTVSGIFSNEGNIVADGFASGSGGSIFVNAGELRGAGRFSADGAGKDSSSYNGPGGGGRIAIYTDSATSTWSGAMHAKGACNTGIGGVYTYCGGDGTTVFESTGPKVSSVLFLPGIEGSRLYEGTGCGAAAEEKLWDPYESDLGVARGVGDKKVADLALNENGQSVCADIYTKKGDVVDVVRGKPIYASLLGDLGALKTAKTINDWQGVAYDWRLSLDDLLSKGTERDGRIYYEEATSTPYVEQTLRALAAGSKTGKVTIVAHSNGGLLAKALLKKLGDTEAARLVDKLILVASPQSGTPAAVASLLVGYDAGLYTVYGTIPIVSNSAARAFMQNAPMAYHLLPSEDYLESTAGDAAHPVVRFSGTGYATEEATYGVTIANRVALSDFIKGYDAEAQPALLEYAAREHSALDAWTPPASIAVSEIAGWGIDTVGGIDFYSNGSFFGSSRKYRPILIEDGDGRVAVPSALQMAEGANVKRYWLNLDKVNNEQSKDYKHPDIFEVPSLREFVMSLVEYGTSTPPMYISTDTPSSIKNSKKLLFFLHSPLTLELTDAAGNVTGLAADGSMSESIPGSSYGEFGEVKYIVVPEGGAYQLAMRGQGSGTFSLDMQESSGGVVTNTATLADLPVTENTLVSLSLAGGLDSASALTVDENGNGKEIITLVPKAGETVTYQPPTVTTRSAGASSSGSISLPVAPLPIIPIPVATVATPVSALAIAPVKSAPRAQPTLKSQQKVAMKVPVRAKTAPASTTRAAQTAAVAGAFSQQASPAKERGAFYTYIVSIITAIKRLF